VKLKNPTKAKRVEYVIDTGPFPLQGKLAVDLG